MLLGPVLSLSERMTARGRGAKNAVAIACALALIVLPAAITPPAGASPLCLPTAACWRPFSASSPYNRPIPAVAPLSSSSAHVVKRTLGFGAPSPIDIYPGDPRGIPMYISASKDPVFTLHCTVTGWGRCPVEGMRVRIPPRAQPQGPTDAHLSVIDYEAEYVYDFWLVQPGVIPATGGALNIGWGGRTSINGSGLGSSATAGHQSSLAGLIRPQELIAGHIAHALALVVRCDNGGLVYPATGHGQSCASIGLSNTDAPAEGTRFWLAVPPARIAALNLPAWKRTILTALAQYGAIVGDTGNAFAFARESGRSQLSFGRPNPWMALVGQTGVRALNGGVYSFPLDDPVTRYLFASSLRVVSPCVSNGTCP